MIFFMPMVYTMKKGFIGRPQSVVEMIPNQLEQEMGTYRIFANSFHPLIVSTETIRRKTVHYISTGIFEEFQSEKLQNTNLKLRKPIDSFFCVCVCFQTSLVGILNVRAECFKNSNRNSFGKADEFSYFRKNLPFMIGIFQQFPQEFQQNFVRKADEFSYFRKNLAFMIGIFPTSEFIQCTTLFETPLFM